MPKTMPSIVDLPAVLRDQGRLRIDIERGFRAPVRNGSVTMEALWRADVYEVRLGKRPTFLGTVVTDSTKEESPADLLRQLASIYEAGSIKVKGS